MIGHGFTKGRGPAWAPSVVRFCGLLLGLLALAGPAAAHVTEGGLRHEILIQERLGGTTIWVRAPLPVVFGDEIARAARDRAPLAADGLYLEQTGTGARYRVDVEALAAAEPRFGARLQQALQVSRGDQVLDPKVTRWRIAPRRPDRPFTTPEAALSALDRPSTGLDPVFGEAVVEYELRLTARVGPLSLQNSVSPLTLPPGVDFDTLIARQSLGEQPLMITQTGQLLRPVTLPPALWQAYGVLGLTAARTLASSVACLVLLLALSVRPVGQARGLWTVISFAFGCGAASSLLQLGVLDVPATILTAADWILAGLIAVGLVVARARHPLASVQLPLWGFAFLVGATLSARVLLGLTDLGLGTLATVTAPSLIMTAAFLLGYVVTRLCVRSLEFIRRTTRQTPAKQGSPVRLFLRRRDTLPQRSQIVQSSGRSRSR